MSKRRPRLIYADSEHDPDMLYACGFFVPDAFVFLENKGKRSIYLSDLEVDRARREARVDEVFSITEVLQKLRLSSVAPVHEWLPAVLRTQKIKSVEVPQNFPLALARKLESAGIELYTGDALFWCEREFKSSEELSHLRTA